MKAIMIEQPEGIIPLLDPYTIEHTSCVTPFGWVVFQPSGSTLGNYESVPDELKAIPGGFKFDSSTTTIHVWVFTVKGLVGECEIKYRKYWNLFTKGSRTTPEEYREAFKAEEMAKKLGYHTLVTTDSPTGPTRPYVMTFLCVWKDEDVDLTDLRKLWKYAEMKRKMEEAEGLAEEEGEESGKRKQDLLKRVAGYVVDKLGSRKKEGGMTR